MSSSSPLTLPDFLTEPAADTLDFQPLPDEGVVHESSPRRHLQVVPPPTPRPARGPFLLLMGGLLAVGLLGLLLINTVLAQGSFRVLELQKSSAVLADQEQALVQKVSIAESPDVLADKARRLGLVPSESPVFLRLSDGRVLGEPKPAKRPAVAAKAKAAAAAPSRPASKPASPSTPSTTPAKVTRP